MILIDNTTSAISATVQSSSAFLPEHVVWRRTMLAVALLQENSQYSVIVERLLQFGEDAFRLGRRNGLRP